MARPRTVSQATRPGELAVLDMGWPEWLDPIAVGRLRDALRSGRIGHAYLLSGPDGVGKANLATAFAQAVCCTNPASTDVSQPCGECRACRNAVRGAHPDVERVDLASQALLADKPGRGANLNIETVRRLRGAAALMPLETARRIIIIDDAETLLEPAQQALLKTLEEPPEAVTLLLLTDESEALLETVRSRCQHIPVRPVPEPDIAQALQRRGIDEGLAAEITLLSRGRPAWAVAAAREPKLLQARRNDREAAASWIASSPYERLVTAFRLGEQFSKRRAAVLGVVQTAVELQREEMLAVAATRVSENEPSSDGSGTSEILMERCRAVRASLQCLSDLEANVRPRLALEAMVLTWPNSAYQSP